MLVAALSVALWIPALLGWGSLLPDGTPPLLRRSVSGMVGLAVVSLLAILASFAVAVTPGVSGAIWVAGAALAVRRRRWLVEGLTWWEALGSVALLALLAAIAGVPWLAYDTGLYHLQSVKWMVEEPVAPGIVHLHARLAFNSAWFAAAAALQFPAGHGAAATWYLLTVPLLLAGAGAVAAMGAWVRGDARLGTVTAATLLVAVGWGCLMQGSLDPDAALVPLAGLALALWAGAMEEDDPARSGALSALVLSTFAFAIKASMLPLLAGGVAILLVRQRRLGRRRLVIAAAATAAYLVPWVVRSFLLSGCLLFPAPATCVEGLPWSAGRAAAQEMMDVVRAWARQPRVPPAQVLASWSWLDPWWAAYREVPAYRMLAGFAAAAWAGALVTRRVLRPALAIPSAIALAGVAWWFLTAPDPRFVQAYAIALVTLPLAAALEAVPPRFGVPGRAAAAALVVAMAVWLPKDLLLDRPPPFWLARHSLVELPRLPRVPAYSQVTRQGYRAAVPVEGDQCWDDPIPCAPLLHPGLERRGRVFLAPRP